MKLELGLGVIDRFFCPEGRPAKVCITELCSVEKSFRERIFGPSIDPSYRSGNRLPTSRRSGGGKEFLPRSFFAEALRGTSVPFTPNSPKTPMGFTFTRASSYAVNVNLARYWDHQAGSTFWVNFRLRWKGRVRSRTTSFMESSGRRGWVYLGNCACSLRMLTGLTHKIRCHLRKARSRVFVVRSPNGLRYGRDSAGLRGQ